MKDTQQQTRSAAMGTNKLPSMLFFGGCCFLLIQAGFLSFLNRYESFQFDSHPCQSEQSKPRRHDEPLKKKHHDDDNGDDDDHDVPVKSTAKDSLPSLKGSLRAQGLRDRLRLARPPMSNNGELPKLYLHVGPSKTATTTIQQDLSHLIEENVLNQDNLVYWGRYRGTGNINSKPLPELSNLFDEKCSAQSEVSGDAASADLDQVELPDCLIRAREVLDEIRALNMSLIISNEEYSYKRMFRTKGGLYKQQHYFSNLHRVFEGWDVTILVGYRRMAEWMISCVKESNARIGVYHKGNQKLWPDEGGEPMGQPWPLVRSWALPIINPNRVLGTQTPYYMYLDGSIPVWMQANFTVKMLNVHSEHHITQQLLCDLLADSAPVSCRYVQQRREGSSFNSRSSAWAVYNQIVYAAANRGLLDKDFQKQTSRIEATDQLEHFHQKVLHKSLPDLPLFCPPQEDMERILNISLGKEEQWMPDFFRSPQGEPEHRKSFARLVYEKRELCSLDTATLFEDQTSWEGLLANLNRTIAWPILYSNSVFSRSSLVYPSI